MGTRFLVTRGCQAPEEYKQMLVDTTSLDIVYTPVISGVPANFLAPYLVCGPKGRAASLISPLPLSLFPG